MRYCQACHRCYGDAAEFCLFDQTPTRSVEFLPLVIDSKYRLEQLIAHGGMGAVYRATHLQLDRGVAIKILRAEFLSDPTISERFNREARAAARLKHPNIVAVYDYGMLQPSGAYLVMELIEGRSLREEMRTHAASYGQMRPERAATILTQVCAGIEAAHRQKIIHRDLKPDNVMIETSADGQERVLVLDFGIAKLKDREHPPQGLTDENTVMGTPNYISPEQCTGQPVDARSDVYSLGVILYEMLTGRVPFAGQNTSSVLLRHLQEPPARPSRFRTGLGRELERVVLRALAKNPNQRFQSAAQFAGHLVEAVRSPGSVIDEGDADDDDEETLPRRRGIPAIFDPGSSDLSLVETPVEPVLSGPLWLSADSPDESAAMAERAPTLLIEQTPRTNLYFSLAVVALVMFGVLGYLLSGGWVAPAEGVKHLEPDSSALARSAAETIARAGEQPSGAKTGNLHIPKALPMKDTARSDSDGVPKHGMDLAVKASLPGLPANGLSFPAGMAADRTQREVRGIYSDWALAAVRGDWAKHMSFYSDKVEYFSNGLLLRSAIELRKRRIFRSLDSYSLRFSQSPQVNLKSSTGHQEADVIFSRHWELRRGKKRVKGEARGLITLRRDSQGWRIVSERQIKK